MVHGFQLVMEYGVFGAGAQALILTLVVALFFPVMFLIAFWRIGSGNYAIAQALLVQAKVYAQDGQSAPVTQPPLATSAPSRAAVGHQPLTAKEKEYVVQVLAVAGIVVVTALLVLFIVSRFG